MLDNVRQSIDDENILSTNVGNRPHYPMFIAFYGADKELCTSFYNNLNRVWSKQICERLLLYRYDIENGNLVFSEPYSDEQISNNRIYESIAENAMTRDVFADLSTWFLYNVIDTSHIGFEEFENSFNSLGKLKYVIDETVRSMVIIILNDTRDPERKETNYRIRQFLIDRKDYDSIILVSNRSRNGAVYDFSTLYRIVSGVVLLSANDAVSSVDDKFYRERNYKLYSKTPYSVAYTSLTKPTMEILLCMTDCFVSSINQARGSSKEDTNLREFANNEVERAVGINNHRFEFFDNYILSVKKRVVDEKLFSSAIKYLPLVSASVISDEELLQKSYSSIKESIFPNAIMMLADDYCRQEIESDRFKKEFSKYESFINNNLNLLNVRNITPEKVTNAFSAIQNIAYVNEEEPIRVYLNNLIISVLLKKYILPQCISLIESVLDSDNYLQTKNLVDHFTKNISDKVPTKGFGDISKVYGEYMSNFLRTIEGEKLMMKFLRIGNSYDDLVEVLKSALVSANKYCDDEVKMPFITLWANTLKTAGPAAVIGKIIAILEGDGDKGVLLRGEFPLFREMRVIMLHCYDAEGNNDTWLYKQLQQAYRNDMDVQFFNTGNDNAIESLKFYKIEGNNLIFGLNSGQNA